MLSVYRFSRNTSNPMSTVLGVARTRLEPISDQYAFYPSPATDLDRRQLLCKLSLKVICRPSLSAHSFGVNLCLTIDVVAKPEAVVVLTAEVDGALGPVACPLYYS
jgi:hypothetical protein